MGPLAANALAALVAAAVALAGLYAWWNTGWKRFTVPRGGTERADLTAAATRAHVKPREPGRLRFRRCVFRIATPDGATVAERDVSEALNAIARGREGRLKEPIRLDGPLGVFSFPIRGVNCCVSSQRAECAWDAAACAPAASAPADCKYGDNGRCPLCPPHDKACGPPPQGGTCDHCLIASLEGEARAV